MAHWLSVVTPFRCSITNVYTGFTVLPKPVPQHYVPKAVQRTSAPTLANARARHRCLGSHFSSAEWRWGLTGLVSGITLQDAEATLQHRPMPQLRLAHGSNLQRRPTAPQVTRCSPPRATLLVVPPRLDLHAQAPPHLTLLRQPPASRRGMATPAPKTPNCPGSPLLPVRRRLGPAAGSPPSSSAPRFTAVPRPRSRLPLKWRPEGRRC